MTDWDKELRKRRTALDRAERATEEAMAGAHADGHPYRWIGERVRMNHETVRKVVTRVQAERCGAPNYSDRCELPSGHEGHHQDGIMRWPRGVERPVDPARTAPARPEEEH
jgi:hypothetical protein